MSEAKNLLPFDVVRS